MTYKEFITECEMYSHSKENFDLMKECSELLLTEKFMEDQQFMLENTAMFTAAGHTFTEGLFTESVDELTMHAMMEKFDIKKKNLSEKIYLGLKKIIDVFKNFFMKIANKFDDVTAAGQAVRSKLADSTITDVDINAIKDIVNAANTRDVTFPVAPNQPYLSKIKFGKYASSDPDVAKLKNDLAAALSDQFVVASASILNGDTIGAIPAEDIEEAAVRLVLGKGKISNIISVGAFLTSSYGNAKTKGIKIRVNTNEITKLVDKLQKISDSISEAGRAASAEISTGAAIGAMAAGAIQKAIPGGEQNLPDMGEAKIAEELRKCYSGVTSAIGQTMKIYTGLNSYRSTIIKGLDGYFKNKPKNDNKKEEKKDDKAETSKPKEETEKKE